jgi:hypothetical protein
VSDVTKGFPALLSILGMLKYDAVAKALRILRNAMCRGHEPHLAGAIKDCHVVMARPHARALIEPDEQVGKIRSVHNKKARTVPIYLVHDRDSKFH